MAPAMPVKTNAPKATPQRGKAAKDAAGKNALLEGSKPMRAKATPRGGKKHAMRKRREPVKPFIHAAKVVGTKSNVSTGQNSK